MSSQMDRMEWKLDMILAILRGGQGPVAMAPPPVVQSEAGALTAEDRKVLEAMQGMSMKLHASLQMIVRGASNAEIADRFGVTSNTAKVYVRSIAKKLGVHLRTQIAVAVVPVLRSLDDDEYARMAKGLPRDWDETYNYERREDDPLWNSYTGSRVKQGGEDGEDEEVE